MNTSTPHPIFHAGGTPDSISVMELHSSALATKEAVLRQEVRRLRRVLVAYSGGVDSAYLAFVMHRELRDDMLAVIADSPSLARTQLDDAVEVAREQGIPLEVISTSEMERPEYVRNDGQRCFHCK